MDRQEMAGTLVCSEVFSNSTVLSDNCTQDIVYPFRVDDFNVTTNLQNWSLTAVFTTSKVFSALGSYFVDIREYTSGPSPPTTSCSLTYVPEVGPITCQCSTKSLGTPPGRLQWLVGDDVIVSGGYGVTQLQFPTNRVNRSHDGVEVSCQLDWVVKQHVTVASSVAIPVKDTMATSVGASVGAALGVSVLVVCLVLVFLWIHRRHSAAETRNESVGSRKDCEENHYSGLFEGSSSETNQRNAKPSTRNPGFEPNVYHNT
ncbi:hypothetical protein C0Q70_12263 [Pomacea canaliculata]|uniref:Ig-like domain-containing protein n=1 Tax=Pomacea canaliculata TaxID=400727 RepID=A0A2T7P126_POMCA|nr:hypothetical protein C0Q70_12263 [Pomacea canaliculata]